MTDHDDDHDDDHDHDHPMADHHHHHPLLTSLHTLPTRRFHLTRRGKIAQSTTERYLRDDLGFGTLLVPDSTTKSTTKSTSSDVTIAGRIVRLAPRVLGDVSSLWEVLTTRHSGDGDADDQKAGKIRLAVVDTNILLHHMDVLEYLRDDDVDDDIDIHRDDATHTSPSKQRPHPRQHPRTRHRTRHHSIANAVVIPQTALEECRHRSLVMYRRVVDLIRSSSGEDVNTTGETKKNGRRNNNKRCFIVFADVHHVDTQIDVSATAAAAAGSEKGESKNDKENDATTTTTTTITINDENDARLRKVAYYYGRALYDFTRRRAGTNDDVEVVFLSDDAQSRKLASGEQPPAEADGGGGGLYYRARSMRDHVSLLQTEDPSLNLLDLVAQFHAAAPSTATAVVAGARMPTEGTAERSNDDNDDNNNAVRYPPHLSSPVLSQGLKTNRYYQGIYRSDRDSHTEGYVTIRRGEDRVAVVIRGALDVNRAVDGDIVAIELYSVDLWLGGASASGSGNGNGNDNPDKRKEMGSNTTDSGTAARNKSIDQIGYERQTKRDNAGIAADTAEPSLRDAENIAEEVAVDDEGEQLRRPTAKIVGIIRRNFHKNYCGSICTIAVSSSSPSPLSSSAAAAAATSNADVTRSATESKKEGEMHPHDVIAARHEREHPDGVTSTVVFFPIDNRIPPILLRTTQRDRLVGMRILVSIDSWPADSEYPLGHYVKTLGVAGTKDTETQVLLQEFRIPCEPFPAKVLACLPPADYKIDLEPGRTDLRHLPVLSIDPPGCKDIDDALHCIELPNGNWQVGVHIADVTHYVEAGTAIDLEAANRSTSTYLVNKRLDMLPSLLTTDLCSLKGNVDRFAFSVLWEVTPEAEIVDVDFKKSIIHSIAALTYQEAQALIDKPDKDCKGDIQAGAVKRLARLARKFRSRRINAGALTLASPEVKFVLDSESLNPTDVQAYTLYEANALVEEFMLLANVTVSKKILRHYPTLSILRRHPAPNRSMFDGLIQKAKTRGITLCIDDSKKLADSLDAAAEITSDDPYLNQLLRILSTRCMSPAQYFCSGEYQAKDWHHYGLAAPVYTHFTSPIRRYADVCVHRLLAAAIGVAPLPVFLSSKSYLHDLAANMNRRHRAAQLAGRASVQLHTLIFFAGGDEVEGEGGGAKEEDAYVLDVETASMSDPSFTVMVPRYGIEGRVRLTKIANNDECLVRDPEKHRLGYKDIATGKIVASVAVFDKVRVRIWVRSTRDRKELVLDLLEPKIMANPQFKDDDANTEMIASNVTSSGKKKKKKQKTAK
ncbi:hypothetical protein ACHAXS_009874 [Conticribra weissflogii]